jgi:hypothetical protein
LLEKCAFGGLAERLYIHDFMMLKAVTVQLKE